MNREDLYSQIRLKSSFLCIGLDTDIRKIPAFLLKEKNPVATFNQAIVEATHDLCVAYKPNIAFYEAMGSQGWKSLEKTVDCIPPELFTIADAKRGDIGNTSELYAKTFFEYLPFDAVTVSPYMGADSILPFLAFPDKWVILLASTSNPGSLDFQHLKLEGKPLYQHVVEKALKWGEPDRLMFVAGATKPEVIGSIRKLAPDHFLLVPGIGAQGGSLAEVSQHGMNSSCGLLVNASRSIIYAGSEKDFQQKARKAALTLQREMEDMMHYHLLQ